MRFAPAMKQRREFHFLNWHRSLIRRFGAEEAAGGCSIFAIEASR